MNATLKFTGGTSGTRLSALDAARTAACGLKFTINLSGLCFSDDGGSGVCANTHSYETPEVPVKSISAKTIGRIFFKFYLLEIF